MNGIRSWMRKNADVVGIILVMAALLLLFSLLSDSFFTSSNLMRIMLNVSAIGVMALGECLVIVIGGIDLGVSSVFALSGVTAGMLISRAGVGVPEAVLAALAAGGLVGAVNGFLVLKTGLTPFIATFGMLSMIRGLAYALSGGYTISVYKRSFTAIGMYNVGDAVPVPVIIFVALAMVFQITMKKTSYGVRLYATGGNPAAAAYSGIRTGWIKFSAYVVCGVLAGLAGIMSAAKLGMAASTAGMGYEMDVITAVILGGVSFNGGVGSALGVAVGAVVMGIIRNGLLIMNVSAYYQTLIIGLVILLVVSLDAMKEKGLAKLLLTLRRRRRREGSA
ncbi:MAG: ABC transporter permease [Planctomycetota bacterium]|nr:ABC transporter permease [Planctomycetota bacterium]